MTEASLRVAACVVNWNSGEDLDRCLSSLEAQTLPLSRIVVVDNASMDGSLEAARRRHRDAHYLELTDNRGFCGGVNAGWAESGGADALLLVNPDAWLEAAFLEHALPALKRPGVGFVSGKILRPDGRTIDSTGQRMSPVLRKVVERGYGQRDRGRYEEAGPIPGVCGAVALLGPALLGRLESGKIFDERFFAFWEDADLSARARRLGLHGWYEPRAVAFHRRGGTRTRDARLLGRAVQILGRPEEVQVHILKNRYLYLARNESLSSLVLRFPALLVADGAILTLTAIFRPQLFRRLLGYGPMIREAWRERQR